ncbi:MAG: YicC/YloC family endoribonuclease [Candidatus Neomarinimicrobiota bacterium]
MLTSMTGFGKAEGSIQNMDVAIEMKSVNSRYLETFVSVPKHLTFLEDILKKHIRKHIKRGNVHCYVNVNSATSTLASYKLNKDLLKSFMLSWQEIKKETGINTAFSMQDILSQPDIMTLEETSLDRDKVEKEILLLLDSAITELIEMERKEGDYISDIFRDRMITMNEQLDRIVELQKVNIPLHIETLRSRIAAMMQEEPDELQLQQEIVQLADKLDISEEIDRFKSHIIQFESYLENNENVGKRLNFLLQEMNREITTMGNKANNSGISQLVVEVKNALETVREQVQNIQ